MTPEEIEHFKTTLDRHIIRLDALTDQCKPTWDRLMPMIEMLADDGGFALLAASVGKAKAARLAETAASIARHMLLREQIAEDRRAVDQGLVRIPADSTMALHLARKVRKEIADRGEVFTLDDCHDALRARLEAAGIEASDAEVARLTRVVDQERTT